MGDEARHRAPAPPLAPLRRAFVCEGCRSVPRPPKHMQAGAEDIDYFVRVQDGKFVVGPSCKSFFISGWNQ